MKNNCKNRALIKIKFKNRGFGVTNMIAAKVIHIRNKNKNGIYNFSDFKLEHRFTPDPPVIRIMVSGLVISK